MLFISSANFSLTKRDESLQLPYGFNGGNLLRKRHDNNPQSRRAHTVLQCGPLSIPIERLADCRYVIVSLYTLCTGCNSLHLSPLPDHYTAHTDRVSFLTCSPYSFTYQKLSHRFYLYSQARFSSVSVVSFEVLPFLLTCLPSFFPPVADRHSNFFPEFEAYEASTTNRYLFLFPPRSGSTLTLFLNSFHS